MASGTQDATPLIVLASNTVTATGNSATFRLPQAESYALILVATSVTGTTPVLNAVLQTALDGTMPIGNVAGVAPTVWVNTGTAFASVTAASNQTLVFKPAMGGGEQASVVTVTPGTASAKNQPIRASFMRLSLAVTGTAPVITFTLYALCNPKGYSA